MDDREARLIALATREFPRLVGVAGLCCGSRAIGEEVAHEALIRLCRHWRRVAAMERPEGWLYRVTLNLAIDTMTKQRRQRDADDRWAQGQPAETMPADPADSALMAAVAALPTRQRHAVVCRYFLDLSAADTAEILECANGTVRALTSQAVANLRHALMPRQPDPSQRSAP
jgi:RNA polymerase sigma factor (sigma-70 family)